MARPTEAQPSEPLSRGGVRIALVKSTFHSDLTGAMAESARTALLEAVADHAAANGGGTLRWITAADNERAQRVYDRLATHTTWVTYERETSR